MCIPVSYTHKSSLELSGMGLENGGWSQTIIPSAYYDKGKKLKLKADGVLVNANKKIELKIDDKYPKKIDYFGKEVIIKDVKYSKGHLTVKYLSLIHILKHNIAKLSSIKWYTYIIKLFKVTINYCIKKNRCV